MTWEQSWRDQRTGWDAGCAAPALNGYIQSTSLPSHGQRALVPGCGSGYDAFALAHHGYITTGLDLAPTAAERFTALREAQELSANQAHVEIADFFAFAPPHTFDLVWDYTFLCAIEPSQRPHWGTKMAQLVSPGGLLLTLLFPIKEPDNPAPTIDEDPGPPYRLHLEHARDALGDLFELVSCEPVAQSHPGREGLEQLAVWARKDLA